MQTFVVFARLAVIAHGCLALACASDYVEPESIRDSSGLETAYDCEAVPENCLPDPPAPISQDPCDAPLFRGWGGVFGRFNELCDVCGDNSGYAILAHNCRPLACDAASDCPEFNTGPVDDSRYWAWDCVDGLCQNRDTAAFGRDLTPDDAATLCFAYFPREETAKASSPLVEQLELALAASCPPGGEICELPEECSKRE